MNWLFLKDSAQSFTRLFFPCHCVLCHRMLYGTEQLLCLSCRQQLPLTFCWERNLNPTLEKFTGRVPLKEAHSLLYFTHHGIAQKLIHLIKYRQRKDLACELGRLLGRYLLLRPAMADLNYLVPLPLHPKKERQRGYNQSVEICRGISAVMQVPLLKHHLIKIKDTGSQTHLTTAERIENVNQAYALRHSEPLKNKHLLLVDDVLTTGATLESCSHTLLEAPGVTLSIATLAIATD